MQNIKILQINKLYAPWLGGVETHVQQLAEALTKANYEVKVLCCNTKNKTEKTKINQVPVIKTSSLGLFFRMPISLSFFYYLKTTKADILHFHLPNPLAALAYLITKPKGKVIVTWHSNIVSQKFLNFFINPIIKSFLKHASIIIVTSSNLFENSPLLLLYKNKIRIIPLSIDLTKYQLTENSNIQIAKIKKEHNRYILFIGRLVYYKGLDILLNAIKGTNIPLIIIGTGPLENKIKKFINKNNMSNVSLKSPLEFKKLLAYLAACEFLILPSTQPTEAFGIVQLEAMALKKPIISTNLPTGVPYVNQHQQTGLIVEPNNVDSLKKAIDQLWQNQELTQKLGENAYQRVSQEFSEDLMIQKIRTLINNI